MRVLKIIKWFFIVTGAALTTLLALSALAFWYMSSGVFGTETFDKDAWQATRTNEEDFTCYRGGMAKDIRDNLLSSKTTKEDVVALLGNPDGNVTRQEYQYVLGMCSGFGFDYDNLHIYFDDQGRFSQATIIQH